MPRLVYFVACRTPIISQEGVLSLVNVVETIPVSTPASADATLSESITAVAYFRREPDDTARLFEIKLRIVGPSGRVLLERAAEPFQLAEAGHRYLISIRSFPLAMAGTFSLQLYLREQGGANAGAGSPTIRLTSHTSKRRREAWRVAVCPGPLLLPQPVGRGRRFTRVIAPWTPVMSA